MRACENCGKVFQLTKRGRRFERRLAERKERAAMGEEKTIFGVPSSWALADGGMQP